MSEEKQRIAAYMNSALNDKIYMMARPPFYTVKMYCSNCGCNYKKEFNKGDSCSGKHECWNCGCNESIALRVGMDE